MNSTQPIDFVVPWVDDTDPVWRAKKAEYTGAEMTVGNEEARYRDWDTLKYWFRGVEKYASWVRYVYFVTDDQKPDWLNVDHPKLKWVKHTQYIPEQYLPTFNSHTIEWYMDRLPGLSEQFVYFNDDVFLIDKVEPEDFFVDGKPCDCPCLAPLYPNGFFSHILFNNIEVLNRHFSLKKSIREHPDKWLRQQSLSGLMKLLYYGRKDLIPNSASYHIHTPFLKSTFQILKEKEQVQIQLTCMNKCRSKEDISTYCVRDWQIFSGDFYPKRPIGRYFHTASMTYSDEALNYLSRRKGKIICLNDTEDEQNFEQHKKLILETFEKLFPDKSTFEK